MTDADRYFGGPQGTPEKAGEIVELASIEPFEFLEGLRFRPVVGDRVMVSFVTYEPNTIVPRHAHAEEQISFVLEGEWEFDLDGDVRTFGPGTACVIPPFVPHAARTYASRCVQVDVFSPPRAVLLAALRERQGP